MKVFTWFITTAIGVAVASWIVPGIHLTASGPSQELPDKLVPWLLVSLIVGLVSSFVSPIVKILSLPFIILTVGFLLLVINAVMLLFSEWIAHQFDIGFEVDGFWAAFLGALIITVVTWGVNRVVEQD